MALAQHRRMFTGSARVQICSGTQRTPSVSETNRNDGRDTPAKRTRSGNLKVNPDPGNKDFPRTAFLDNFRFADNPGVTGSVITSVFRIHNMGAIPRVTNCFLSCGVR